MKLNRALGFAAPFLVLGLPLALGGCGLQPVYSGGAQSAAAQGLAAIEIAPMEGRSGWFMRNALSQRFSPGGSMGETARYRLDIRLDDQLEGYGLLSDDRISRERRSLRARYQLVNLATGEIILDAADGSDAGIDVVSSEYATIAAETRALENLTDQLANRMVTRLAMYFRQAGTANK